MCCVSVVCVNSAWRVLLDCLVPPLMCGFQCSCLCFSGGLDDKCMAITMHRSVFKKKRICPMMILCLSQMGRDSVTIASSFSCLSLALHRVVVVAKTYRSFVDIPFEAGGFTAGLCSIFSSARITMLCLWNSCCLHVESLLLGLSYTAIDCLIVVCSVLFQCLFVCVCDCFFLTQPSIVSDFCLFLLSVLIVFIARSKNSTRKQTAVRFSLIFLRLSSVVLRHSCCLSIVVFSTMEPIEIFALAFGCNRCGQAPVLPDAMACVLYCLQSRSCVKLQSCRKVDILLAVSGNGLLCSVIDRMCAMV